VTPSAEGAERAVRGGPQRIPRPSDARAGAVAPWGHLPEERRHPSVDDIRAALASAGPPEPSPAEARRARPSGVLVALYDHAGEAWVVLTRRSSRLRAHSGEVSFPGGGQDPTDPDLAATALREAWEETGLDPEAVEVIGELDHLSTISSRSFIVPVVGVLDHRPDLVPSEYEVDAILHVPLSELLLDEVYREEVWRFGGADQPIVFFELIGDTVWGATAAVLRQLLGFATGTLGRGDLDHD
jgi:8-oxo-dGTP pyrophosphatase MutT (NUDIX family)